MVAIYLAPLYILLNVYLLRWMYLWVGSCHYLFQTMTFRIIFAIIYIFASTSLLSGFLIKKPRFLHRLLKITGNYFLGIFMYTLMVVLMADGIRLILKYVLHVSWIQQKYVFTVTGAICAAFLVLLSLYGIFHAKKITVTPYQVTVNKKVPNMDSMKIVLLADTHFGYNAGVIHAREIVRKINKQNPDLVCIAGDIFDNEYDAIMEPTKMEKILRKINSHYGVYACWGNHDLNEPILAGFTFKQAPEDVKDPRMKKFLENSNIHPLRDESVLIDDSFYVVGRKDASLTEKIGETRKTPEQLMSSLDKSKPVFIIDHQPKELQKLADAGADLDLCGHTHDGQLFPGNLTIKAMWENPRGLLQKDSMTNVVTSGAGVWGPAMRIGTDSEICVINVSFK